MANRAGWNEDSRSRGKLNGKVQVGKDEVTTLGRVIGTAGENSTKTKRNVCAINMVNGDDSRAAVERGSGKYTVFERRFKG